MNAMQDVLDEMDPEPGTSEHYDWIRETYGND